MSFDDDPTDLVIAPTQPREALALDSIPPPDALGPGTEVVAHSTLLAEGARVGDYQIVQRIGQGAMGTVYEAVHPLIGKKAAVKVLAAQIYARPDLLARFVQEARAVAKVGHPNIVDAYSFGTLADGRCYFVMEWLQGKTLGERLAEGRLPLGDALDILDQICRGLAAAHDKGIIHRDLKPENVFLVEVRGEKPRVKLLDFSIAKLDDEGDRPNRTQTGVMLGTPLYVSPEQAKGRGVDHRTDLYALGVMAYEVVVGQLPFFSDSSVEIVSMHLHRDPPRPSDTWPSIPPALERLILALLAKDPAGRPTLSEVRAVLADLRGLSTLPPPEQVVSRPSSRRVPWSVYAGAAVIVALGFTLAWYVTRTPEVKVRVPPPRPAAPAVVVAPTGSIIVRVDVPDARIEIDGRVVAESAESATVAVDQAGPHSVKVTAPAKQPFEKVITVGAGAAVEVRVRLDPAPASAPESAPDAGPLKKPKPKKPKAPSLGGDHTVDPFKVPPRSR